MKLNISNEDGRKNILDRVQKLGAETQRLWGKMNVNEMLLHCNNANQLIFSESATRPESMKQKMLKFIFLKLPLSFPKNIKAPKRLTPAGTNFEDFEKLKVDFIQNINRFESFSFPAKMYHPAFGNLTPQEWGIATWMHMDHHLRQFNA